MSHMVDDDLRKRFERSVLARLHSLGLRLRYYVLLDGLAVVAPALLAAVLITLAVDYTFKLGWDMRAVQLTTLGALLVGIAWWSLGQPMRIPIRNEHLAILLEKRFPQLKSRLISAVEFADPQAVGLLPDVIRSTEMIRAVIGQAAKAAADLRFQDALAHQRVRRRAAVTVGTVIVMALIFLAARETMSLWFKRNVLLSNVDWPQKNRLTVEGLENGTIIVARGDDVTVSARVDEGYAPPRQAYIEYKSDGGLQGREQMPAMADQIVRFRHTFERMTETLHCRITGGDASTFWFTIEVVDRPRVSGVGLGIVPPAYTKIDPYDLRPGQTVAEALKGSKIIFRIEINKPVISATLIRQFENEHVEISRAEAIGDREYKAADLPEASAYYYFRLIDELGLSNQTAGTGPVRFSVRLVADKPPKVEMKIKGVGEMITTDAVLPVETDFSDLYGLAWAALVYELSPTAREPVSEPIPGFTPGTKTFGRTLEWSAAAHKLAEGDRVGLHAEASDYDDVSGPNVGRSATIALRVVGRDELLMDLGRREQEYRQDFERLIRLQEELYADLLTQNETDDSELKDRERLQRFTRLARRQRDQAGRANALRLQFEQVLSELQVNKLSNPGTETRLGKGVVEPMQVLSRSRMPAAAEQLDNLSREQTPDVLRSVKADQDAMLRDMNRILANMIKWEGFQEAITLLRQVIQMQNQLNLETEKRIETEVFGAKPQKN